MKNRVKYYRDKLNWSQRELARHADVSNTTVGNIENGETAPSLCTAIALASALSVEVSDLFPGLHRRKRRTNDS